MSILYTPHEELMTYTPQETIDMLMGQPVAYEIAKQFGIAAVINSGLIGYTWEHKFYDEPVDVQGSDLGRIIDHFTYHLEQEGVDHYHCALLCRHAIDVIRGKV